MARALPPSFLLFLNMIWSDGIEKCESPQLSSWIPGIISPAYSIYF